MAKNFFEIQAAEQRKIWLLTGLMFVLYFGVFFLLTFTIASFFEQTTQRALMRALPTALVPAIGILALQLWFADRHGVRVILEGLSAKPPDSEDHYHQRLIRLVDEVGVAAGGVRAQVVVVPSLALNALALADSSRAVIGLTEGAVSTLTRDQTRAVVAHEMAHIVNRDCRLATWVCAMTAPFIALADALEQLEDDESSFSNQAAGAGVRALISLMTFTLSRKRESRADATAIQLTRDPLSMAEAIHRISNANHFVGSAAGALAPIFILPSRLRPYDEKESFLSDLFSSHPPTRKRLGRLLEMANVSQEALVKGIEVRPSLAPVDSLENQLAEQQKWELRTEQGWSAPMLLAELTGQTGFGPQSWVRRAGADDNEGPAFTDPLLNRFFRREQTGQTVLGKCPRCEVGLEKVIYEGLPVGKCPKCSGYLVAELRVTRLLKRREIGFDDTFRREVEKWADEHAFARGAAESLETNDNLAPCKCPVCGKRMFRRFYSYQYFIPVDRCFECQQIWFDNKELELLQALVERAIDDSARPALQM